MRRLAVPSLGLIPRLFPFPWPRAPVYQALLAASSMLGQPLLLHGLSHRPLNSYGMFSPTLAGRLDDSVIASTSTLIPDPRGLPTHAGWIATLTSPMYDAKHLFVWPKRLPGYLKVFEAHLGPHHGNRGHPMANLQKHAHEVSEDHSRLI